MIETIRRLLDFSDRCRTDLLCAFGYGVLYSVSEVIPVLAIVVALEAVLSPSGGGWFAVAASGGLMGLSVAGKIIFGKRATERRMLASYDMCADKRIEVGEILKRVPLGYFSQNRLGELTATLTTTLGEIETNAVAILDKVANGFVHAVAITLLISWYDRHAGLITPEKARQKAADTIQSHVAYYKNFDDHGRVLRLRRLYHAMFLADQDHGKQEVKTYV